MSAGFDPYLEWFGIPVDQRPPTHYQMLNLAPFESNPQTIESQAQLVLGFLNTQTSSPYGREAQQLIARIQQARMDLLDPTRKAQYDASLRGAGAVPSGNIMAPGRPQETYATASNAPPQNDPWAVAGRPASGASSPYSLQPAAPPPPGYEQPNAYGQPNPYAQSNPYAAPQTYGGYEAEPRSGARTVLSSRWYRFGAQLLEGLLLFMIGMAAGVVGVAMGAGRDEDERRMLVILTAIGLFIPYAIISIYMLSTMGQSIGKYLCGIRIVNADDGSNPGFFRACILRNLVPALIGGIPFVGAIFSLVDILFIFNEDRRCLHDMIAGTVVVDV